MGWSTASQCVKQVTEGCLFILVELEMLAVSLTRGKMTAESGNLEDVGKYVVLHFCIVDSD
jgi:hypothetical protein